MEELCCGRIVHGRIVCGRIVRGRIVVDPLQIPLNGSTGITDDYE